MRCAQRPGCAAHVVLLSDQGVSVIGDVAVLSDRPVQVSFCAFPSDELPASDHCARDDGRAELISQRSRCSRHSCSVSCLLLVSHRPLGSGSVLPGGGFNKWLSLSLSLSRSVGALKV